MTRAPFDPAEAFDAMAERFRRETVDIASDALEAAVFRDMTTADQLHSLIGGILTGVVGIAFAMVQDEERDLVYEAITEYLPLARQAAEAIIANAREDDAS
jgi:uncharacterized metal-binding protein